MFEDWIALIKRSLSAKFEKLDEVLSALAHPARRQILLVVRLRGGSMSAGEIANRFPHAWPTTSRHLRVLEKAGLLEFTKSGRTRTFRVNLLRLNLLKDWLRWFDAPFDSAFEKGFVGTVQTKPLQRRRRTAKISSKQKEAK